jgi:hypothetical protein
MFLLILFVVASVAATEFGLVLRARQAGEVGRHRNAVPAETVGEYQRAADYKRARLRLGAMTSVFGLVVTVCWALFWYDALYGAVAGVVPAGLTRSVLFLVAVGLMLAMTESRSKIMFSVCRAVAASVELTPNAGMRVRFG